MLLDLHSLLQFLKQLGNFEELGKVTICQIKAVAMLKERHSFLETVENSQEVEDDDLDPNFVGSGWGWIWIWSKICRYKSSNPENTQHMPHPTRNNLYFPFHIQGKLYFWSL